MFRVLIIGCGAIAGGYDAARTDGSAPLSHAGAYRSDDRFELSACVDSDREKRTSFAERWKIPSHAASIDALVDSDTTFDIVSVCSPTEFHAEHIERALRLKPRLIFCEKPVAQRLVDAENLVAACAAQNTLLAVNYTRRWDPAVQEFAKKFRAGHYGALLTASAFYGKGVVHNGGHMIDLLQMIMGDLRLLKAGPAIFDHWQNDPSVSALLQTKEHSTVALMAVDSRAFTRFEVEFTCEAGIYALRDGGRRFEIRSIQDSDTYNGYREAGGIKQHLGQYECAMSNAIDNIAGALSGASPLASTGANALAAHRLCDQIRSAALTQCNERRTQ